jgi:hypothetical protein
MRAMQDMSGVANGGASRCRLHGLTPPRRVLPARPSAIATFSSEGPLMETRKPDVTLVAQQRQRALSCWENEGGAESRSRRKTPVAVKGATAESPWATAEVVQLRIRVIALENLVIALLAESPDRRLGLAREMASHISPRPGFTPHRLTIHAAAQMIHLIERAGIFRVGNGVAGAATA